jgi:acetyl-CoA decarbonylase/synthase complex subunit gamma
MALTGLEIFKQLPQTNCKDCAFPTCLAFAVALASGKVTPEKCPHLSASARAMLTTAFAPPMALIKIGPPGQELVIGNETVLFRHEKRFEHAPGLAVLIKDNLPVAEITTKISYLSSVVFKRLGENYGLDLLALENCSGEPANFKKMVAVAIEKSNLPLILMSENPEAMAAVLSMAAQRKPLIYSAQSTNYQEMTGLAQKYNLPLAVKGKGLDELAALVEKITALGHEQLVLDTGARETSQVLFEQTQLRRLALNRFKPFGYPTIAFALDKDPIQSVVKAGVFLIKYAGIVVLTSDHPADLLSLITLRLNIYSDPQKPMAVESKIYPVGNPGKDAPVVITTNFSLTYYCVANDFEASRIPGYIIPVDTDGASVLTSWAAGKLTAEKISEALQNSGIAERVTHRKVIIPGGVAMLSKRLTVLSGWEVIVGTRESSGIPSFLKREWVP